VYLVGVQRAEHALLHRAGGEVEAELAGGGGRRVVTRHAGRHEVRHVPRGVADHHGSWPIREQNRSTVTGVA